MDCFLFSVAHETLFFELFRFQKGLPVFIMNLLEVYNFDNGMTNFSLKFYKALLGGLVEEQDAMKTSQIMCTPPLPQNSSESKTSNIQEDE